MKETATSLLRGMIIKEFHVFSDEDDGDEGFDSKYGHKNYRIRVTGYIMGEFHVVEVCGEHDSGPDFFLDGAEVFLTEER